MGGVTIVRLDDPDQPKDGELIADRRLCVNAAKTRLIEAGDPEAAFLLAGEGGRIGKGDVERLGLALVDGRVVQRPIEKAEAVDLEPVFEALKVVREQETKPNTMVIPVQDEDAGADAGAGDQEPEADSSAAAP